MGTVEHFLAEVDQRHPSGLVPCDMTRILVVDDEQGIREAFRRVIGYGMPGCRVDVAINGAEALAAFEIVHHGLLVMDLRMPIMDGESAFFRLQDLCYERGWQIPSVVFCTAFTGSERLKTALDADDRHCLLRKPIRNDELFRAIRERLS